MNPFALMVNIIDRKNDKMMNGKRYDGVVEFKDIIYDKDDADCCKLDVFIKKYQRGKRPVILNIHGGGFVATDKKFRRGVSGFYADKGYPVVNIAYGLAPKYKFKAMCKQCYSALKWIKDNAEEYDFDVNKIFVMGDSAGAYLATSVALMTTSKEYMQAMDVADLKINLAGVILYCGVYNPVVMMQDKKFAISARDMGRQIFGIDIKKDYTFHPDYPLVNLVDYVGQNFPATLVTHTDSDALCGGQGEIMISRLRDKGVPIWEYHNVFCKLPHDWQLGIGKPMSDSVHKFTLEFLKERLDGKESNRLFGS